MLLAIEQQIRTLSYAQYFSPNTWCVVYYMEDIAGGTYHDGGGERWEIEVRWDVEGEAERWEDRPNDYLWVGVLRVNTSDKESNRVMKSAFELQRCPGGAARW